VWKVLTLSASIEAKCGSVGQVDLGRVARKRPLLRGGRGEGLTTCRNIIEREHSYVVNLLGDLHHRGAAIRRCFRNDHELGIYHGRYVDLSIASRNGTLSEGSRCKTEREKRNRQHFDRFCVIEVV
jgi:hypothetical protein